MSDAMQDSIAVVSDVSLGFGSPQVQSMARSLAAHYGTRATIFEPDSSGRPPMAIEGEQLCVHRIPTDFSPYSSSGRIQYVRRTAECLNQERPAVVAIFCTFALPVLSRLDYRPRTVIYSLIEMIEPYGAFDVEMNRHLAPLVDIVVFPEENRARIDSQRAGFGAKPMAVLYNVSDARVAPPVPARKRLRRIFYGGAISMDAGMADHLLHPEMREVPLDLYGDIGDEQSRTLLAEMGQAGGETRYQGFVDAQTLAVTRRNYAYSLVMYRPTSEMLRYAAPNKLFEAIADGVPPIVAPHPQCKMLVERYRCGLVMRDWSFEAYRETVQQAMDLLETKKYARLVENCQRAAREELNWNTQFEKVRKLLPRAA